MLEVVFEFLKFLKETLNSDDLFVYILSNSILLLLIMSVSYFCARWFLSNPVQKTYLIYLYLVSFVIAIFRLVNLLIIKPSLMILEFLFLNELPYHYRYNYIRKHRRRF